MTNTINTNNQIRNSSIMGNRTGHTNDAASNQQSPSTSGKDNDQVSLQSASLAQSLSERIQDIPEVNQAKVDAIKDALAKGEYKPDPEAIARKFTEIESLLP